MNMCIPNYRSNYEISIFNVPIRAKARVESCSAATTLATYVKNFPG